MLTPETILYGYSVGIFPMADPEDNNRIFWYEPEERGIIPLDAFHVSENLKKLVRRGKFQVTFNKAFESVIRNCSELRKENTWISEEIIQTYCQLHETGWAHSVETWYNGELAGGLYGVAMGKAFFGESMFYKITDASKVALVHLVEYLRKSNYLLLDIQYLNSHTRSFGGIEIPSDEYKTKLEAALTGTSFDGFFTTV